MTTDRRVALGIVSFLAACLDPHADLDNWQAVPSPTTTDLVDISVTDETAWVLQADGVVRQRTGDEWIDDGIPCSGHGLNVTNPPRALHAAADDDVWVVGGDICHFDGNRWSPRRTALANVVNDVFTPCAPFIDVFGRSATEVWVLSERCVLEWETDEPTLNGGQPFFRAITTTNAPEELCANSCRSANDRVCDDGGTGASFRVCALGTDCNDCGPRTSEVEGPVPMRIWASEPGDIWAITKDEVLNLVGNEWIPRTDVDIADGRAIWGSGPRDVYVTAGKFVMHFDGVEWTRQAFNNLRVSAVWGASASDVWAVGSDAILSSHEINHWDGSAWTYATRKQDLASAAVVGVLGNQLLKGATGSACCALRAVDGRSAENVWAVGSGGTVLHYAPSTGLPLPR